MHCPIALNFFHFNLVTIVVCIILISTANNLNSQNVHSDSNDIKDYNNAFIVSIGPVSLLEYFPVTAFYEHMLLKDPFGPKVSTFIDIGAGLAANSGGGTFVISIFNARYGILTGTKKDHFETSIGMCYFGGYANWYEDFGNVLPSFSMGYRSQKPGRRYVFRTGIGMPEQIYASWGVRF